MSDRVQGQNINLTHAQAYGDAPLEPDQVEVLARTMRRGGMITTLESEKLVQTIRHLSAKNADLWLRLQESESASEDAESQTEAGAWPVVVLISVVLVCVTAVVVAVIL